jgi:pyridoxamine 5'-phosphate oxidase
MSRSNDTYIARQAPDYFGATDPFALFDTWFAEAKMHEPNDPNAMSVATVDTTGMPNVRIVLLKGLDEAVHGPDRGFVFYTNHDGAKGRELLATGKAALNFHWKSLSRQVRIRGTVSVVTATEADAYYASRPRGSRIGAWASQQSRPLPSRADLEKAVADYERKFGEGEIPRPTYWSGFRVTPLSVEFWHDRPFRLHDRLLFARTTSNAAWTTQRLSP